MEAVVYLHGHIAVVFFLEKRTINRRRGEVRQRLKLVDKHAEGEV